MKFPITTPGVRLEARDYVAHPDAAAMTIRRAGRVVTITVTCTSDDLADFVETRFKDMARSGHVFLPKVTSK